MKTVITALIVASVGLLAGCVAVPTRHGLVVAPAVPVVGVGVGYHYGPYDGPYYGPYR
jgi:hypothetical protein